MALERGVQGSARVWNKDRKGHGAMDITILSLSSALDGQTPTSMQTRGKNAIGCKSEIWLSNTLQACHPAPHNPRLNREVLAGLDVKHSRWLLEHDRENIDAVFGRK